MPIFKNSNFQTNRIVDLKVAVCFRMGGIVSILETMGEEFRKTVKENAAEALQKLAANADIRRQLVCEVSQTISLRVEAR